MMLPHLKRPIEHQLENIGYRQLKRWNLSKWYRCNMLINLLTDSIVGFTSLASNFCQPESRPDPQILMSLSPWSAPTGGEALRSWPSVEQANPCSWGFPSHIPSSSSPRSPCLSDLPRSSQTFHPWQIAAPSACRLFLGCPLSTSLSHEGGTELYYNVLVHISKSWILYQEGNHRNGRLGSEQSC